MTPFIISLQERGVRWPPVAIAEYVLYLYICDRHASKPVHQVCHIAESSLHNVLDSDDNVAVLLSLHSTSGDHVVPDRSSPRHIKI